MNPEPSDPVERADKRREAIGEGEVKEKPDGTIEQRGHGSMDPTLVPKGKDHPEQGLIRRKTIISTPMSIPLRAAIIRAASRIQKRKQRRGRMQHNVRSPICPTASCRFSSMPTLVPLS